MRQKIIFKEKDSEEWIRAQVIKAFKKSSKYKDFRQLKLEDGSTVEKDFRVEIDEWHDQKEDHETEHKPDDESFLLSEILNENENISYPVKTLLAKDHNTPEVLEAKHREIEKFKDFGAIEEVEDVGQERIPSKWVITKTEDDVKNQPLKARLCIRGDLEQGKEYIRSDSPTAGRDTLKLVLMIAANERFEVKSGDIKSAFLQGQKLERDIFVKPPGEASVENKLWKLNVGAYGTLDGGRLFYLRLVEELTKLGMHQVHADGALFTFVENGKLMGLVTVHVDDLILAGNEKFHEKITSKLQQIFKFSKVLDNNFKYCGCHIKITKENDIELDQNAYIENISFIPKLEGENERELNPPEKKLLKSKVGELLWVALMTRPDISFDVNRISSMIKTATVKTAKDLNNTIKKAKSRSDVLKFTYLGPVDSLRIKVYTDASFGNQDDMTRSTGGTVVFVEDSVGGKTNILSLKTKKINRVCRSVKAAETRALEDGLDEAINAGRIIKEIYNGKIDLKDPEQIPVDAFIDSKSLYESLHSTKQCEEKLLRNSVAGMKELMQLGAVANIVWVPTEKQLADCMTKKGHRAISLLELAGTNVLKL